MVEGGNVKNDNVIHAFPKSELPEQTLVIEPPPLDKPFYCQHSGLRINAHERTIACAHCGQTLDPFDFIHQNAVVINRAWQDHAHVKREMNEMQVRVTALKKEEKRLRATVKRLGDKSEIVIDVRGKALL